MASLTDERTPGGKTGRDSTFHHVRDRLPRDKSGKELRFDECPSGRLGPTVPLLTRKTSISLGPAIHVKRWQYRVQQRLHAHLGFAWSAPGRPRRRFSVDDVPQSPSPRKRRVVNFEGVPLCERSTRCQRGLPTSDTVTKVVIVWNTSAAGEASSVSFDPFHRCKPWVLTCTSHLYNCRIFSFFLRFVEF